jgi:hypothetical protein
MSGAIPPLPNMFSWYGAQLKKSTETTLPLPFRIVYFDLISVMFLLDMVSINKYNTYKVCTSDP